MPKVKICGNTNVEDAKQAAALGADYLGFIFAESKRKLDVRTALNIMESMPQFKNFVAVFYNQPKQEVESLVEELGIKYIQFHGDETALYCNHFMEKGYQVIKTFRIKDSMSLKRLEEYNVSSYLFDTFDKDSGGGTGKTFDWKIVDSKPFVRDRLFLAGGLNVENLREAIDTVRPYAVDVASGVESSPGKKDPDLLARFIQIAKEGTQNHAGEKSVR